MLDKPSKLVVCFLVHNFYVVSVMFLRCLCFSKSNQNIIANKRNMISLQKEKYKCQMSVFSYFNVVLECRRTLERTVILTLCS